MSIHLGPAGLMALWLTAAGCGHSEEVREPAARGGVRVEQEQGPDVGTSPEAMLGESGVVALQRALSARGLLDETSGVMDLDTHRALVRFQREQNLAPTGQPDLETLRRLGLDARELYRDEEPKPSEGEDPRPAASP